MSTILNKVFLNSYYNSLGAKFAPFAGYSMPVNFNSGIINEHIHTRNKCGLFDISHMGVFQLTGSDVFSFLQRISTNDVERLLLKQLKDFVAKG